MLNHNYNFQDFTEFDTNPGRHYVIPRIREEEPKINLNLALNALKARVNIVGSFVKINKITFTGYVNKEPEIDYTVVTRDQLMNMILNHDQTSYEFF